MIGNQFIYPSKNKTPKLVNIISKEDPKKLNLNKNFFEGGGSWAVIESEGILLSTCLYKKF